VALAGALAGAPSGGGRALLIEGPAGIGKTALVGELEARAGAAGQRVLKARGSEMERGFGFGVVRQLFGPVLRTLDAPSRAELFAGPAAISAAIFGMAEGGEIEVGAAEASLYGLFWFLAALAESERLVLAIDDAHWSDTASLRFFQYLGRRLDGLPVLLVLAARPNEPGVEAEMLRGLTTELEVPTIRPSLLSEAGTATIVRDRLGGEVGAEVATACHQATGGNPLLIHELLAELDSAGGEGAPISAEKIATMGPERIAAEVIERASRLDPRGPEVVRAVAVLGDGADQQAVAALAEADPTLVASILDGLAAASILVHDSGHGFVHPLLRGAVYEGIPAARRAALHARAAELLAGRDAEVEKVAAHLLLCEPGSTGIDAFEVLDGAAEKAAERGAADSAVTYLRRAIPEVHDGPARAELLRRLGSAEVALRDPASIEHLQQAAELTEVPRDALDISLQLVDVLSIAGQWEATVQVVDAALARFGETDLPGVLDLEAFRAAYRAYDPARVEEYNRDLPRLRALVEGRSDDESSQLRWLLAAIGGVRDAARSEVLALIQPSSQHWTIVRRGRDNSFVGQAMFALLLVGASDEGALVASSISQDGRRRGSLMAMISGVGYGAALDAHRGRLGSSEESLNVMLGLIRENELSLMALTTFVSFCLDTIVERHGMSEVADLIDGLELPPPFGDTQSGGMVAEVRAAVRLARGDRAGGLEALRTAERIFRPLQAGPRFTQWRSRLALALPASSREEALELAREEHELARGVESPRAEGVALRVLGVLTGGDAGIKKLRESVAVLREQREPLELARSLAELGAALRRGNQRAEAREQLREAADLAQRCGAERLEERVHEELGVAGARPRRQALSGADSLTPGEHRVAAAAAGGATNREIAQDLFVSLRTVEMHLTNAYRKLDISSRSELAGVIEEPLRATSGL
jgi:DNA-binding CsgD family transcriptional regulator